MAKQGPGPPNSAASTDQCVMIMNDEIPPKNDIPSSVQKRKRECGNESSPTAKRRVTGKPAQDDRPTRKSTRLSRLPAPTRELQRRSGSARPKEGSEMHGLPSAYTPRSRRAAETGAKAGKVQQVQTKDNTAFESEGVREGISNTLVTLPLSSTAEHGRRASGVGQIQGGEQVTVDRQPGNRVQTPSMPLTNGMTTRSYALVKLELAPTKAVQRSSARQRAPEEQAALAVGGSEHEVHFAHQDATPPEEPLNPVGNRSTGGHHDETAPVPDTDESFEEAFSLYDCKEKWETMVEAAQENLEDNDRRSRATELRELAGLIKSAEAAYHAIRTGHEGNMADKEFEIEEVLVDISERISTIHAQKDRKKDARLIKGIYVEGIPKMVGLLKMALATRSHQGELSVGSLKELIQIIDAALNLCKKAYHWRPRPVVESGVRRRTGHVIKMSLDALRTVYIQAQYDSSDEDDKEAQRAGKRQVLADQVVKFLAEEEEKKKLAEQNQREINRQRHRRSVKHAGRVTDSIDIDDVDLHTSSPAPAPTGMRRSLPWRVTGVAAARRSLPPAVSSPAAARARGRRCREHTEDIPGPMVPDWSQQEDGKLLHGLELFRGANRYLEIDRIFGSAGGPLNGRDVDGLMQRARFLKQTMASRIEEDRERLGRVDHWAFLLTVDG